MVYDSAMGRILEWLGLEERSESTSPSTDSPSPGVTPPARSQFTSRDATSLSTVYRALSILETSAMQLTVDVWRGEEQVERPALVRKPDLNDTGSAFYGMTTLSMATSGDFYWKLQRNARNEVSSMRVLNPWECEPSIDEKTGVETISYKGKPHSTKEIYHGRLMRIPGSARGLGPIQAARAELHGIHDLTNWSSGWFSSGDVPTGVLKSDQPLTPEQAEANKERWKARDAHDVAVLGSGLDYRPIMISPKDAQFIENQNFSVVQVARLFGIPAAQLLAAVEGGAQTYQNIEQADLQFVRWTLMRYLREMEEALSLILPGIQTARFNLDGLLRPDTKTRYEAHGLAINGGWMLPEEVRKIEGLPTITLPKPAAPVPNQEES
jgi:HK97 family phage portal protein